MDVNELFKGISPGDYVTILLKTSRPDFGPLVRIDSQGKAITLYSRITHRPRTIALDEIDTIRAYAPDRPKPKSKEEQLKEIPLGKYLMIWGNFGEAINQTVKQGKLKSIDWDKRTLVLTSTTYQGREYTVPFDQMTRIDTSRSGSGALGSVQTPDLRNVGGTWYRGNTEVGSKGYEDKKRAGRL